MQRLQLDDARGGGADLKRQDFDPLGRAMGVAGLRRDNQDEVRQAKLASSSRCKSGPGKG
jgi:thiamine pyrophosphate-dependent acetolactate synthase large subunit-like protein